MKINKLTQSNAKYPKLLAEIVPPPSALYYLGNTELLGVQGVAIVGARKATPYGRDVAHRLAYDLATAGLVITSGLAYGIDTIAHRAALEAGGKTIAVMAGGLDRIYPAANRGLAKKILAGGGLLISEYAAGEAPLKHNFVARNRIISGLSLGVVVAEAGEKSGALITAGFALEQNRAVMAIPGNVTSPASAGTNSLIQAGAHLITSAADVLAALGLEELPLEYQSAKPVSKEEALLLELLSRGINDSDALIKASALSASEFNRTITLMEISGKVRNLGAGKWAGR